MDQQAFDDLVKDYNMVLETLNDPSVPQGIRTCITNALSVSYYIGFTQGIQGHGTTLMDIKVSLN